MGQLTIQDIICDELIKLNWCKTETPNVLTKNDCVLFLANVDTVNPRKMFCYTQDEIQEIITNDFNLQNTKSKVSRSYSKVVDIAGVDYYLEKYGWLLTSGKYSKELKNLNEYSCDNEELRDLVNQLDVIAEKDNIQLKGVKQRLQDRVKVETYFKGKKNGNHITEGCFIEVAQDSKLDSLFQKGALFRVTLLSDKVVIVTSVNKKGTLTNKNYEVDSDIFVQEAMSKNIYAVDIVPYTEEIAYSSWEVFGSSDVDVNIPEDISKLLFSDKQKEFVNKSIYANYNVTALLNPNSSEESYLGIFDLCKLNYLTEKLLTVRLRESTTKILAQQVSAGFNPDRFLDDSIDSFDMELEIQEAFKTMEAYRGSLERRGLSSKVIDILCKYYFKTGCYLDVDIPSDIRWQYLLPYVHDWDLSKEAKIELVSIIKSYGILTDDDCILKSIFFTDELKGWLLRYFRSPIDFVFQEKSWNDLIYELINGNVLISISEYGVAIRFNDRVIARDLNSFFIADLFYQPKWRCVLINDKAICYGDSSDICM